MKKAGLTLGSILLCAVAHAATVNLIQTATNDADGSTLGAVFSDQYLETALTYTTGTAPAEYSGYGFTHWSNSSYPATSYRDVWGRSLNPISFVLLEDTTATAHYLPSSLDTDVDGLPDWYEIEYFGDLSPTAASDGDGDGILLSAEYAGGTHPLYGNSQSEGGVAWADSGLVVVNLAGYASYTLSSVPAGTVDQSVIVPPGTVVATPDLSANASFGYWTLDGVRQQDAWGVAYPQISFTVESTDRVAVAYLFAGDSDSDGVDDAYEQYIYGSLANDGNSDTDGDGITLLAEFTGGTNPLYANTHQEGGVAWADSAMVTVNLAGFSRYTLSSLPAGSVDVSAIVPDGTTITTPNMTQANFGYWELDGVRQQDTWGVALRELSFIVDGVDRSAVAHLFATDSDADGINDGFEQYHYGTLANAADSDSDGDGLTLLAEYTASTNPLYGNSSTAGGVAWHDSALVVVNLQPFERLENILVDGILDGFFSPAPSLPTGIDVGDYAALAACDWDGDGDMDLFVAHEAGLRIWENIGTANNPNFHELTTGFSGLSSYIAGLNRPRIAGGDWNGDGYGDLVIGGATGTLRLIASAGAWAADGSGTDLVTGSTSALPALGDMDGDGLDDLLVLLADGTVRLYQNDATSTPFTGAGTDNFLGIATTDASSMATGDINQDGLTDVLVADNQGRIWEFLQNPDSSFLLVSKVWGGSSAGFASGLAIAILDLEADGDIDLIGGLANGGMIALRDPSVGRPSGLVATPGADSILLNWNASAQSRIRGYYLYRGDVVEGPFANLAQSIIPLPRYTDATVTPGAGYFYYATAISRFFLPGNSEPRMLESLPSDFATVSAGEVTLSLRPIRGKPSKYVRVKLAIDNALGIRGDGLQIEVLYDPAVIVPAAQADSSKESVISTGLSRNLVFSDNGASASGTLIINGSAGSLEAGSGKLFTLQFKVAAAATLGTQTSIAINSGTMFSIEGDPVTVLIDGPTTLEIENDYIPGDMNGDGILNKDDEDLIKYFMKPKSPTPSPEQLQAGDLNGDGEINPQDLVLFKRLLRGLD